MGFLIGNVWFLWYPISQAHDIQLPLLTIMLLFIVIFIQAFCSEWSISSIFNYTPRAFIGEQRYRKAVCIKVLDCLVSREGKINIKSFNIEVRVRNSNRKTMYF